MESKEQHAHCQCTCTIAIFTYPSVLIDEPFLVYYRVIVAKKESSTYMLYKMVIIIISRLDNIRQFGSRTRLERKENR